MKVAIVGAGISGLVCASQLAARHEITVFEANDWIGGHTHTVDVPYAGKSYAVDTGFIVYNERNYPHFSALLNRLQVATQPTRMTFGFASERTGLEYCGSSLGGLFAQRRNLVRPAFWGMLSEVLRFFREARALLAQPPASLSSSPSLSPSSPLSLGAFLEEKGFATDFQNEHLLPMGAAIWSCPPDEMRAFPATSFARFFENHGLLRLTDRPEWRVVAGGSARYVEALTSEFRDQIRPSMPVQKVSRSSEGVEIELGRGSSEFFDAVVFACHSDQALGLLDDATPVEKETLGAIRYQPNDVVLHTDEAMLPRASQARGAWNYHVPKSGAEAATVTYDMNALQGIDAPVSFLVTLNSTSQIDPARVIERYTYAHPVFNAAAIEAQAQHAELGRGLRTAYCGAYWGYGFHEDGVRSGLEAAALIEERLA